MCVRSLGYIVGASPPPVKICVSVRWVTLWVRPPPWENMCVCSLGYIVGASPPRVCPFIGIQSLLDPCMLPTPLYGIFYLGLSPNKGQTLKFSQDIYKKLMLGRTHL